MASTRLWGWSGPRTAGWWRWPPGDRRRAAPRDAGCAPAVLRRPAGGGRRSARDRPAVRLPLRGDPSVRANRGVRANLGGLQRRGDEGDVHVRGQGRPVADAEARVDRPGRPGVPDHPSVAPVALQGLLRGEELAARASPGWSPP